MIRDSGSKFLFVDPEFQEQWTGASARLEGVEKCFSMGPAFGEYEAFAGLMAGGTPPEVDVPADDGLVIIYTAAVDVHPRGALLSHANILAGNIHFQYFWNLTPDEVHVCMLPLCHILALGLTCAGLQAGGTNVILPKFDPDETLKAIERHRGTYFGVFPPIMDTLLNRADEIGTDLTSLRRVSGLDGPETIRRFQEKTGGVFWVAFGQSETSGLVTMAPFDDKPGSAGRLGFLSETAVADEQGRLLETGATGEIVVRGPVVFKGYWGLPDETAYTFRDGWHHTGDLGRFDEDGFLWYMGRTPQKDLIKPGGENVYPAEVEKALLEHPDVVEACVIGVPDARWGEAVKAVCSLKAGSSLTAAELIEFVGARIARYKKPQTVTFVPELPKTQAGLIDRLQVKADHGQA